MALALAELQQVASQAAFLQRLRCRCHQRLTPADATCRLWWRWRWHRLIQLILLHLLLQHLLILLILLILGT